MVVHYYVEEITRNEGIKQKFEQNPHLKEVLMDTGNKTLVESCLDNVWGTGKTLSDPDCLKWRSIGILGRILMKVRDSSLDTTMDSEEEYDEDRPVAETEDGQVVSNININS